MIGLGGDAAAGDNVPIPRVLRLTPVPDGQDLRPGTEDTTTGDTTTETRRGDDPTGPPPHP